jgi:hypothetical protein
MLEGKNIIWFEKFPNGRFANSCFQFLYAEYLKKLGYEVILGGPNRPRDTELPWQLFNLPENNNLLQKYGSGFFGEGKERMMGPSNSVEKIKDYFKSYPGTILSVDGYFQFDTQTLKHDSNYLMAFEENFGLDAKIDSPFQKILKKYREKIKFDYLITIHVRRGDYLDHINS